MKLIGSQKDIIRRSSAVLSERGIAFLSGLRNGKTFNLYGLLEGHDTLKSYMAKFPKFTSKEPRVIFIEHVRFPRSHNISTEGIMRLILQAMGLPRNIYYGNIYDVRQAFCQEMLKGRETNTVFTLWIDNAENLPRRAYTVLKELNELRFEKKEIGLAIAMAGQFEAMRNMPYWFEEICTEIMVTKLKATEIIDIIEELYPKEKHHFLPITIRTLEQCGTTGVMRKALRTIVDDIRDGYADKVDTMNLSKMIVKMNEKLTLAKAA